MLSDGGDAVFANIFAGIDFADKRILEIGSGLGSGGFYLARQANVDYVGLEINAWLVEESNRRAVAKGMAQQVKFQLYEPPHLPFDITAFDIVFSRGVLVHVEDKVPLFCEVQRVLSHGGLFLVDDWLSAMQGAWSPTMQAMFEQEGLTLYADTIDTYLNALAQSGFTVLEQRDENPNAAIWNQQVVDRLQEAQLRQKIIDTYGEAEYHTMLAGYQHIVQAITAKELQVCFFKAQKP